MAKQDELKRERNKQRQAFYSRFRLRIIEDHFRRKIYRQFLDRCFNCGCEFAIDLAHHCPWDIAIDHHVPLARGGLYELGNLVVLCRCCNGRKHDKMPDEFYPADKLSQLEDILTEQRKLFSFEFDWEAWARDRTGYLASLGIEPDLIQLAFTNEYHKYYIEPERESCEAIRIELVTSLSDSGEFTVKILNHK